MKKNNFLLAVIITALGFVSCKKESTIDPGMTPAPVAGNERLLLSSTDNSNNWSFEYNTDKTLKKMNINGAYWAYEYQPDKLTRTLYFNNNVLGVVVCDLEKGLIKKNKTTTYDANGNIADIFETIYTYNAKGLITQEQSTKNSAYIGVNIFTYDSNDDIISFVAKDKDGVITSNSEYEYDLGLVEKSGSFSHQFNSNGLGSIFPKRSKHLIKKQTSIISNKQYHFSYTLDAAGYVVTAVTKDENFAPVWSISNVWQ